MAKVMVFRSVDGADYRVSVERTSVDGLAALVKFTRDARYWPRNGGGDGTMWVESAKLHFITPRKAPESPAKGSTVKRTGVTASVPPKASTRVSKATGTVKRHTPKGSATPNFQSF